MLLAVCLGPKLIFRNGVALATNVSVSYSVSNIVPYGAGPDTTKHSNVYMTETFGGWHPDAKREVKKLGAALSRHTGQDEGGATYHL